MFGINNVENLLVINCLLQVRLFFILPFLILVLSNYCKKHLFSWESQPSVSGEMLCRRESVPRKLYLIIMQMGNFFGKFCVMILVTFR